ncbi:MAM and LDL-receptor class A domain-containing protein 1-like [Portunus trituberculatus]|uniref:MAM and LDL-receptor class A domain-containing protein 1-like n=1 Tax=Portunus trituberculatus TaxID=210409 RepID=UPI001E1CCB6B|nr:MAM and LDL-receptor class A domain-containing protein 1-like [Portunus trituberculatus]
MAKFSLILFSLVIFISVTEIASQRRPWSRCGELSLENGKVRIKNRGRVAKFRCKKGFTRFDGDRFATCVRQQWNGRIPKCVRRGCSYLTPPQYGELDYLNNQAVVRVTCDPGYTLKGQDIIVCNSRVWNATVPACQASYTSPPMACTFERDTCGWTNSPHNHFFWELKSAALLHLFDQDNSPVTDHTLGTAAGKFMIASAAISAAVGASDGEGPRATLYSPVYKAAPGGVACFTFFYHIYGGRGTGELRVYLKPQDRSIEFVAPDFQTSSRSHASWVRQRLVFTNVTQPFQIVFESEEQGVFYSDVAVDDVIVNYDRMCTATTTTTTTTAAATTITTTANATTGDVNATTTTTTATEVPLTVIYENTTLVDNTTATTTTTTTTTTATATATDFSFLLLLLLLFLFLFLPFLLLLFLFFFPLYLPQVNMPQEMH